MYQIGHLLVYKPRPSFNPGALPPLIRGRMVDVKSPLLGLHIELAVIGETVMQVWTSIDPGDRLARTLPRDEFGHLLPVRMTSAPFDRNALPDPEAMKRALRKGVFALQ